MDVCVIDIIQTSMYRRPWPVRTHWPATCDVSLFGLQCALRRIHTMRRRFGDRSVGGSPSSVPSPSQLDWARTRDRVGSAFQVLFRVLNYPGLGSKFGSREPGYPLTSLLVIDFATSPVRTGNSFFGSPASPSLLSVYVATRLLN